MKELFLNHIKNLQNTICSQLEELDGVARFQEDAWLREEGGGGFSRILENGAVFEKAGVNISTVHGVLPEAMQEALSTKQANFFATGISLVIHPKNPFVPTVHANWRYFELYDQVGNLKDQWFGGGQDLTPYYLFEQDVIHFHTVCRQVCDKHDPNYYKKYKQNCDNYFWNTHRKEARGIGGLFFDYLKSDDNKTLINLYNFVSDVGKSFLDSYLPIVEKRKNISFESKHKEWQEIRRGRYVEFNLIHDRGTLFGLKTNGRIESILMSLPPHVQWRYNHEPEPGSEEEKLVEVLKKPKNWLI